MSEKEEQIKIELEVDESIPWSITDNDRETIQVLSVNEPPVKKEDIERIKKDCPTLDSLRAYYYTMKTQQNQMLRNEAQQLSEAKGKDLTLRAEYYKEVTLLFLKFLYGEYENNMDRELPDEAKKRTDVTQGEFMEFTDVVHKKYLDKLKDIYETEKYKYAKEGVATELRLKMLFTRYHKELFGDKNEVAEK